MKNEIRISNTYIKTKTKRQQKSGKFVYLFLGFNTYL